jgi:hypothetical protein
MEFLAAHCSSDCRASLLVATSAAVVFGSALVLARLLWSCFKEVSSVFYTIALHVFSYIVISYLIATWIGDNSRVKEQFLPEFQFTVEKLFFTIKQKLVTINPLGVL